MQGLGWRPTLMGTSWAGRPVQELTLRPAAVPDTRARGRSAWSLRDNPQAHSQACAPVHSRMGSGLATIHSPLPRPAARWTS
jgi:hypothetical protein